MSTPDQRTGWLLAVLLTVLALGYALGLWWGHP